MLIRTLFLYLSSSLAFAASFPALTYSTYLRDSFTPKAIATDAAGNIYVAGNAIVDPASSQRTVLVVKLNPQGSQYLYVRYLGGSVQDSANALAVDAVGNAYIAGATASPDFPVSSAGHLAAAPAGLSNQRSFVVKLDPSGGTVFATLLSGSAGSAAQAVAVNAAGQVIVSGMVTSGVGAAAFPSTASAYNLDNPANHPYLLELDAAGAKVVFSATGIGGSALALDPAGNIYVAGSTALLDYPTTPGAYQSTLPVSSICFPPCSGSFQGTNQYVTKVDPAGSKLIYSTGVSGNGNTINGGMAVDAAGNVFLTGYAGPNYPYSVAAPTIPIGPVGSTFLFELPFLTKLDPAGKSLLFSVPLGGAGVRLDALGSVYVSGAAGGSVSGGFGVANNLPVLANVPAPCLPNGASIRNATYVAQADAATGALLGSQFIGGSTLAISSAALTGSTFWMAGVTTLPDFALTPNAVTIPGLGAAPLAGAYLGAVDFSRPQPTPGTPQISCILDSANLAPVGAASRLQLLTIFGTNLGPATGVTATDNSSTTLGGVTLNTGSGPAPLLYASSTQVNFAVPTLDLGVNFTSLQLSVNGANTTARLLPLTFTGNPSVFLASPQPTDSSFGPVAFALNADGSVNSPANPAGLGSGISIFVNGLTPDPLITTFPLQLSATNGWSVTGITPASPFVLRVNLRTPTALVNNFACTVAGACSVAFTLYDVGFVSTGQVVSGGEAFGGVLYVKR